MDSEANKKIKIRSLKSQTEIEFDIKSSKFSQIIEEADPEEPLDVDIDEQTLLIIKKYLEDHDYDATKMEVKKPFISENLAENVDEKTFQLLKDYSGIQNIEKIKPLVDAAYFLNFEKFKEACLAAIASEFYVGPTEQDLEKFKQKHGIKDLTPEEELEIMQQFEPVFNKLNEKFRTEMEKEQKQFEDVNQN